MIVSDWHENDSDDNAESNAIRAAPPGGQSNYVTSIAGSYDAAVAGALLQLKDDTTVIWEVEVHNSFSHDFSNPIKIDAGNSTTATLAASGTGGTTGRVSLTGYTK